MRNLWTDDEAQAFIDRFAGDSNEDLALRVYTSRLIGRDRTLVLHGGGNTSVKTTLPDRVHGTPLDVLCVKGSGWDLVDIEPPGLPAVLLEPLRGLRGVAPLSDEEMVNQVRSRLLDVTSPTPSVETLLHAFLPHKFVDHTHADAILALTDQPDGEQRVRDLYGDRVAILPWIMPGHPLAEAVADAVQANPDCEGVVLLQHGIFSFGETAKESYDRMIDLCAAAEKVVHDAARSVSFAVDRAGVAERAREVLPVVRGALSLRKDRLVTKRWAADLRTDEACLAFAARDDVRALAAKGPLTPDHVIRTKGPYLSLRFEEARDPERVATAVAAYETEYAKYFEAHKHRVAMPPVMLDPKPRIVLVEGVGLIAFGSDPKAASVAGDIAVQTVTNVARAEALGTYTPLDPGDLFEMEYWSLEQAKLGKKSPPPLNGRIAFVTGAAGAIGCGIAEELLAQGASVAVSDLGGERLDRVVERLEKSFGKARVLGVPMDVTQGRSVTEAFDRVVLRFGGLDCLVPNAGIAHVSELSAMDDDAFDRVVQVNLNGVMRCIREAAGIFEAQGHGGDIVVQASKNVFAPGAGFGAYSASKAGALQLARVAALELAPIGVRVNAINADAVFGDDEVPSGLWELVGPDRMKSRGLDPEGLRAYYRDRSLLKVEVTARDVGRAVAFFAAGSTPTTGAVLPVDAGVAGAFPR